MRSYLLINSVDRIASQSVDSSEFVIQLKQAINNVVSIKLISAQIPSSYYNIVSGVNDQVCWNRSSTNYNYQIPAGNYSIDALASQITTGMNGVDSNGYTVTYSSTTLKVNISSGPANPFILNWATNPEASTSVAKVLGWTATDDTSALSHTAPNVFDLSQPQYVFIYIPEFPKQYQSVLSSNFSDNITFVLNTNSNGGQINTFNVESNYLLSQKEDKMSISSFSVNLYSTGNQKLQLNGAEWSFLLEIETSE